MRSLALLSCPLVLAAAGGCNTPLGIPCSTIRYETNQWTAGAVMNMFYCASSGTAAVRSDGSWVSVTAKSECRTLFRSQDTDAATLLYSAPLHRAIRIEHKARTVSYVPGEGWLRLPPAIWSGFLDGPPRGGDAACAIAVSGIATDFAPAGDGDVAGTPVKRWRRGDGVSWQQEVALAPSLGCAILKHISIRRNWLGIPVSLERMEVVSVQLGEPDMALFIVPAAYREVPITHRLIAAPR